MRHRLIKLFPFLTLFLFLSAFAGEPEPCGPTPSDRQIDWQEMEMYAFLHYNINTYTGEEWGFGNEPTELFNPEKLDARQWAKICKDSGMKGIILTAKHHAGFCLWPSEYTEYSVKNSPWKDGKGDVVKELAEACKEYGLKFAVYLSPWDRNHPEYGNPEYITYFRNQLKELLTGYGDMFEVWFDGANGGNGWYGGANELRKIDKKTYYDWGNTYALIRELQPEILIWNDGGLRGDLRWVGTEDGYVGQPNWSLLMAEGDVPIEQLHHGVENGDKWVPGEVNTSIRPGWFYHEREDNQVKSLARLMDTYYKSVGRNGTLLLNFPIRPDGLIDSRDSITGLAFNNYIQQVFSNNLSKDGTLSQNDNIFTLTLKEPVAFNRVMLREPIKFGQRVKSFKLEALKDGEWVEIKDELLPEGENLSTIGYKRIICLPEITSDQIRLTVIDSKCEPLISDISLYYAPTIVEPLDRDAMSVKYIPTREWVFVGGSQKDKEWMKAIDNNEMSFFTLPVSTESFVVDMQQPVEFSAFSYMPSRGSKKDGLILNYELSVSQNGKDWETVSSGEFSNIENNPIRQTVNLPKTKARFVKLTPTRLSEGSQAKIADFKLLP